jgi:aldehyde oxidoreductase
MPKKTITFRLNGSEIVVAVEPSQGLLHLLRNELHLTGAKQACDSEGECGACTVLLDGRAVRSCLTPIGKVAGRNVVTIEGLGTPDRMHPLQQAFIDHGAVQCGFCTPGMILSAAALLATDPNPSRESIVTALEGNLCRCTGYSKIIGAIEAAGAVLRGELPRPAEGVFIGGSLTRLDAEDKVTGRAQYAGDIGMEGLVHAAVVRSPHPHGRVQRIDPAAAAALTGVIRILTAEDIPGLNSLEGYSLNEHLLAATGESVRMVGDPVALVIGESLEVARFGAERVRVDYEPLAHTYDASEAMSADATAIYPGGNLLNSHEIKHGDVEGSLLGSDLILETRYCTRYMEHAAMEPETVLSYVDDEGRVTVVGGHQQPHWARTWIATMLGLPDEDVRVMVPPMGGAFGGKQDPWPLMAAALAAYRVRRPVRLSYSRRESFDASPKRHPYDMELRVGANVDGRLTGLELKVLANTGAYDCDGFHIPQYALVAGGGPYRWESVDASAQVVYTNGAKAGQMRGFGTPQSAFALECTLDEVAFRLGVDPLAFRLQNAIDDQSVTFLGYPVVETLGYRECLQAVQSSYHQELARASAKNETSPQTPWRSGVGVAGMWYRFGKPGRVSCEAHAELSLDGAISLFFAAPDYGQGTATVMHQLAAETLGLPRECLRMVNADTAHTPDSGIQGASRSTYWVGGAVSRAALVLRDQVLSTAAEMLDVAPGSISLSATGATGPDGRTLRLADIASEMERIGMPRRVRGVFVPQLDASQSGSNRPEYLPFFVAGAHVASVDVNVETGQVNVGRIVAAHDVGRVINPLDAQGQVEGAILMSLGAALMEEYIPGVSTGFSDYYLPTIRSAPAIDVILVEVPSRWGPHGAKGLGEGATLPTAPAILNGIFHATGARVRQLPATPERVLRTIRNVQDTSPS